MLKPLFAVAAGACLALAACGPTADQAADQPVAETAAVDTGVSDGTKGADGDDGVLENAGEVVDGVGDGIEDSVNDATDGNPNTNP